MHKTCRFFASKSDFDKTKAGAFKASAFVLYLLSCRNFFDCAGQQADGAFFLGDMGAIHNFFLPFWIAIVLLPIVYQIVGGGKGISTKRALST